MIMPKLLHDAKNMRRLMGLSKPLPSRYVDKMKMMPSKEKMDVTLSVTAMALIWLGVASAAMMFELVVSIGAHPSVNAELPTQRLLDQSDVLTIEASATGGVTGKERGRVMLYSVV